MTKGELVERLNELHFTNIRELYLLSTHFSENGEDGVLILLGNSSTPLLSGELMKHTGLTTGRIANILKRLEEKGLIFRERGLDDFRKVYVSLTEQGKQAADERIRRIREDHQRMVELLGEQDAGQMVHIIEKAIGFVKN